MCNDTVDGSEIRRAPVDMVGYLIIYKGFAIHPNGGWPWDFWSINSDWHLFPATLEAFDVWNPSTYGFLDDVFPFEMIPFQGRC